MIMLESTDDGSRAAAAGAAAATTVGMRLRRTKDLRSRHKHLKIDDLYVMQSKLCALAFDAAAAYHRGFDGVMNTVMGTQHTVYSTAANANS